LAAKLSAVGRVGAVADEADRSVLTDAPRALRVCAGERLGLTSGFYSSHLLIVGKVRQIDVFAVDAHAPDTADEELSVARPKVPWKSVGRVHRPHEEERP